MENRKTMLIVDDMEINRAILTQFFQDEFHIIEAENGREALDFIKSQPIDIILLDLMMPVMTGMEVLEWLLSNPRYGDIPVIVTTSADDVNSEVMAMERGAADYLTKPYNPSIVSCRVQNVLGRRENEISKLRQAAQDKKISAMQQILDIDQLTGLLTQKAFLQQAADKISGNPETRYCFVYLNIASFKLINELFNMETGDTILKTAASYFNTIVGKRGLASHLTADSFAILLPEDMLDMDLLIQGLDAMMHSLTIYRTVAFFAGVYQIDNIYLTTSQMLDRAHMAMTSVKNSHARRFAFYDDALRTKLMDEQIIAREMEPALNNGQFFVKYQPIYKIDTEARTMAPIAAEALLRWQHPEQGIISPDRFIPVFEKNGFINRVDRFAWEQACHFLSRQRDWGLDIQPISINISHMNFYDMSFVDYLLRLLRKYDLQPWMLWLELTEKSYNHAPEQLTKILRRLNSCGFSVILDDFGSSFSSLGILRDLTIDMLKVDVRRLYAHGNHDRVDIILQAIIDMAKKLNMQVIAEGVETPVQAELLQTMGCHTMQGFHYSLPLNSDAYIELLSSLR